jgi:hypothetical protein
MVAQILYKYLVAQMSAGMLLLQRNRRTDLEDAQTMTEGSGNAWFLHIMVTFRRRSFTFLSICRVVTSPWQGSSPCDPVPHRITFHLVLITDHKSFFCVHYVLF